MLEQQGQRGRLMAAEEENGKRYSHRGSDGPDDVDSAVLWRKFVFYPKRKSFRIVMGGT